MIISSRIFYTAASQPCADVAASEPMTSQAFQYHPSERIILGFGVGELWAEHVKPKSSNATSSLSAHRAATSSNAEPPRSSATTWRGCSLCQSISIPQPTAFCWQVWGSRKGF
eukprot:3087907-Amphidinium_carterae.1